MAKLVPKSKNPTRNCNKLAKNCKKIESDCRILASNCGNLAISNILPTDCDKVSQTGESESHDDVSTSLKVKTKTIRVLLDTGSSGDLLFMKRGTIDIPIA